MDDGKNKQQQFDKSWIMMAMMVKRMAITEVTMFTGQITEWKIDEGDKRVYVKRYGEWGTVCNSGWDDTEASLLCQHLGYSGGSGSYRYRDYNV